jgi:hypothetical protein
MRSNRQLSAYSAGAKRRTGAWWSISALVLGLFATSLSAQTPAMAPAFQVNTYTMGYQVRPSLAVGDSGFVVTWQDNSGEDGSLYGVFGQRYDSTGSPQGTEFQINTYTTYRQELPSMGMDADGNFVVVWQNFPEPTGQRFDDSGMPLGDEFQLNTYTMQGQGTPSVAVAPSGDFMAAWISWGQDGSYSGIFGQRFDSTGTPQGDEFQVNTYTTLGQYTPAVGASTSGLVVVWRSDVQDNGSRGIFGQRYDNSGSPLGVEFQVNNEPGVGWLDPPSVAMSHSGGFVVAWQGYDEDSSGIFARRFNSSGEPEGSQFQVNTYVTNRQDSPSVGLDGSGRFVVVWSTSVSGDFSGIFGQRYTAGGEHLGVEFQISPETTLGTGLPRVGVDTNGNFVVTWMGYTDGSGTRVRARLGTITAAQAQALSVDVHASGDGSHPNGIIEPGETVLIEPAWRNAFIVPVTLTGTVSNLTGPPGPSYDVGDDFADYGAVDSGVTTNCFDAAPAHDCYQMTITGPRPSTHWDATFDETLSDGSAKTWTLHLGASFADVATSHPFYAYVEDVLHSGITAGCGDGVYCPDASVTRAQMAVFLLKAEHGPGYPPPPCTGVFGDVPCPSMFADWVERLAAEGITAGCGGGNYCPGDPVTRAQMAVFLLKVEHGSTYAPPPCIGIFADVPCPSLFADWIEQLAIENITGGCGGGNYCPNNPITRGQMAVFLVKTFQLSLYGP